MKELVIFWLLFDLAFSETFQNFSYISELDIDFDKHVCMLKPGIFLLRIMAINPKNQLDTLWGVWCSF